MGSFIYLVICYFQFKYEIDKVYESYERLKVNYKEILTEDDLLETFKNDEMANKMKRTIEKSKRIYLIIWIAFLILALIVVEILSTSPIYKSLFDIFKNILRLIIKR